MKKKISEIASGIGHALGIPRKKPLSERISSLESQRHQQALQEFYNLASRDTDSLDDAEVGRLSDLAKMLGYSAADAQRHRDSLLKLHGDAREVTFLAEREITTRKAQENLAAAKVAAKAAADSLWQAKKDLNHAQVLLSRSRAAGENIRRAVNEKLPWAIGFQQPT